MAGRKQRIDSASAAVKVMAGATKEIAPPSHVRMSDADWPFWHSVVAEFAKSEWTDHQLEVAAQLAKAMADLEDERNALRKEGYVLTVGEKQVANPRHGVARDLTNSCMSLRRNLSLHARAQGGEARDIAKRREQTKGIEANNPLADDDDLLARPILQ
jgi:hypothetical protein